MCVLVEARDASNANEVEKAQDLWNLLDDVYAAHPDLVDFTHDRRKLHAAELVIAAWKTHQSNEDARCIEKPKFLEDVSQRLTTCHPPCEGQERQAEAIESAQPAAEPIDMDLSFDIDFEDIDWGFWNSID